MDLLHKRARIVGTDGWHRPRQAGLGAAGQFRG
jgi:hypothetical protein